MKQFLNKKVKNKLVAVALAVIIAVAFFVRVYNFDDWLYFKMDQARDAMLITNVLENGPGYLPLLGPRAGATEVDNGYLRLGPAYYYMQYLAGLLSGGNEPMSNAYPDLALSIAVLPLLYIFLRLYFNKLNSLLVVAMYAFSFLIIEYSRFAWNPNTLPFFMILAFYGMLRFFSEKDFKKSIGWIALWSFGLAVGAQLHFFGFFSLLGISGLMLLWHWKVREIWKNKNFGDTFSKIKFKSCLIFGGVALGVFLLASSPLIISDVFKKGENSKNFMQAFSSKPEKKPLVDKITKDISESFKYYCLLSTSKCVSGGGFDKKNIVPASFSILFILAGIAYAIYRLKGRKETDKNKRNFLFLIITWFSVFFILLIPVSFQLRPRFFIVVFALPFILAGFLFEAMQVKWKKAGMLISLLFFLVIIFLNVKGTLGWFQEQRLSQLGDAKIQRTLILKNKDGVTLGQLQRAVSFMYARHRENYKLYYYVKPEHVAPVKFLLRQKKDASLEFSQISGEAVENSQFFAITTTGGSVQDLKSKFGSDVEIIDQEKVGQITVSEIKIEGIKIKKENMFFNRDAGKSDRVFWKDVFGLKEKEGASQIEGLE